MSQTTLVGLNVFSTFFMTGVIWFVQLVHYPLMKQVRSSDFQTYEWHHQLRTTIVVMPAMVIELVTAFYLAFYPPRNLCPPIWSVGAGLVAILWVSTFLVQMPLHLRLLQEHDTQTIQRLTATNWIRTTTWTLRSILVGFVILS